MQEKKESSSLGGEELIDYMKQEIIAELGKKIIINRRNIYLAAGQSAVGKTSFALCLTNSALLKGYKCVYFDSDDRQLVVRGHPNLFSKFVQQNPQIYKDNFLYISNFNEEKVIDEIKKFNPRFVVIDNIYNPFLKKYKNDNPMQRAKKIKKFLVEFRRFITENDMSAVITSPSTRIRDPVTQQYTFEILGGESVKYVSDTKYFIYFCEDKINKDTSKKKLNTRIFERDRAETFTMRIDLDGEFHDV